MFSARFEPPSTYRKIGISLRVGGEKTERAISKEKSRTHRDTRFCHRVGERVYAFISQTVTKPTKIRHCTVSKEYKAMTCCCSLMADNG